MTNRYNPIRFYQSEAGSNGNERALRIPQSSGITGTSPSDCIVSYTGHSMEESYPFAENHSVYSTAPADWRLQVLSWLQVSNNAGILNTRKNTGILNICKNSRVTLNSYDIILNKFIFELQVFFLLIILYVSREQRLLIIIISMKI